MRNHLGLVLRAAVLGVTLATLAVPVANGEPLGPTSSTTTPAPTSTTTPAPTGTTTPAPTGTKTTTPAPTSKPTPPTTTSRPTGTTTPRPPLQEGIFLLADDQGVLYVIVGCNAGKPTEAHSDALDIDPLEPDPADDRIWGAMAYLRQDAAVGHHTLSARCGGHLLTFDFEVKDHVTSPTTPGATAPGGTPSAEVIDKSKAVTKQQADAKQIKFRPKRVETGFGGTASQG